jgi:uncharacterized membrane protein YidH (DUF202 family)
VAIVVFGFAIGRFAIALRQLARFQGQVSKSTGLSVWMGMISILGGVAMVVAGLLRYRKTRALLDQGKFEPAGFVVDLVTILTVLFGSGLGGIFDLRGKEFWVAGATSEGPACEMGRLRSI